MDTEWNAASFCVWEKERARARADVVGCCARDSPHKFAARLRCPETSLCSQYNVICVVSIDFEVTGFSLQHMKASTGETYKIPITVESGKCCDSAVSAPQMELGHSVGHSGQTLMNPLLP
jgi:hypothetical protein